MPPWGSLWGTVLGPAPALPNKEKIGAIYLDELEYDNTVAPCVLLNTIPESDETDVPAGIAVQLTIAALVAAPLIPIAKVWITRSSTGLKELAYDQAGGGFQAGFSGTATIRQSPGAAVNDELVLAIQPVTPFTNLDIIIIEVNTEIFGIADPFWSAYTFTIEDLAGPQIESIFWLNPRKCRVKFDEPPSMSTDPGGARFVLPISGGIEVLTATTVRVPKDVLESTFVDYVFNMSGSYPANNKPRTILAVNTTTGVLTLNTSGGLGDLTPDTGIDKDSQGIVVRTRELRASISPYYFNFRSTLEGLTSNDPADTVQAAYLPFPISSELVEAWELSSGENPDEYLYLVLNDDISYDRLYSLYGIWIEDLVGNLVTTTHVDFTSPTFGIPETAIKFWDNGILAESDKTEDTDNDRILRKLVVALQDIMNMLHYRRERIKTLLSPDTCPDEWLDHLLYNLGNPFRFPGSTQYSSLQAKRKLAEALVDIYRHVGTKTGIKKALKVILGYDFVINAYYNAEGWILGDSVWGKLGFTTILHPDLAWQRNSYEIVSPVVLNDTQRRIITDVATWVDPVFMHLSRIVEPGGATPVVTYIWIMGSSSLGVSTVLGT
jgi:phage tail-like protein